jgi:Na+/H+ antiporter NhaD/arsenite permease-like protein
MEHLNLTTSWAGIIAVAVFLVAYGFVMAEERLHVRKSVPVLLAAIVVWVLVGLAYAHQGAAETAAELARQTILEFAELLLFLIPAMTFVNTLQDRGLFDALRVWLIQRGLSLRALFWVTGALAFVVSPVADNLTTALLMGAVAMAVGRGHPSFVSLACVNIVVAANAGGVFSPFGDITTLMVWQAGKVAFSEFFALFVPSLVNWLVPACILSFAIRGGSPTVVDDRPRMEPGALTVLVLFLGTIALTVTLHNFLALPPAVGMMGGLALLKAYSYLENARQRRAPAQVDELDEVFATLDEDAEHALQRADRGPAHAGAPIAVASVALAASPAATVSARPLNPKPLDIFALLERIEWDTLMFFYGVLMAVGGLGALGYLALASQFMYGTLGATAANILVGLSSAVIDNVPVMFAVIQMSPEMSHGQWLLVTLTAGVGGSLLSVGSAAGVALMGQARGIYTFGSHLRWIWAIALGYSASVATHLVLNASLF